MSSRPALALGVALLVIIGVGGGIQWWLLAHTSPEDPRYSPLVPMLKLVKTPGYKRVCNGAENCPAPLSCVTDLRSNRFHCLASECQSELQCETDSVCQAVPSSGPLVRLCLPRGTQKEGQPCTSFPLKANANCEPGLHCNFNQCGRACRSGDSSMCPSGTYCREELGAYSCGPTCLETGCPSGQECIRMAQDSGETKLSLCEHVLGTNCEKTSCPEGEKCLSQLSEAGGTIAMWCAPSCAQGSKCPEGLECFSGDCRKRCDYRVASDCPAPMTCVGYGADWYCTWYPR